MIFPSPPLGAERWGGVGDGAALESENADRTAAAPGGHGCRADSLSGLARARSAPTSEQPDRSLTLWTGNIVDSFSVLSRLPLAPPRRGGRKGPQGFGAAIDAADRKISEGDD